MLTARWRSRATPSQAGKGGSFAMQASEVPVTGERKIAQPPSGVTRALV
jgi:hypothetical protein